jgi:ATP-dependent protease ClpP protease subunit
MTTQKRRHPHNNNDDQYDDTDEHKQIVFPPELLQLMCPPNKKVHNDRIFRDCNHLYFRGRVTMQTIGQLCALIDDANNHYNECCNHEFGYLLPKPLYLHICTMGGDLQAGFMAYDYIKNSNIPIYTVSEGRTISAGTLMFMAGKKRFMSPTSYMLIHQLSSHASGTHAEIEEEYENCLNMMDKMKNIYISNLNTKVSNKKDLLNEDDLVEQLKKDEYWDYNMCYKKGLLHGPYTNTQNRDKEDKLELLKNIKEYAKYIV